MLLELRFKKKKEVEMMLQVNRCVYFPYETQTFVFFTALHKHAFVTQTHLLYILCGLLNKKNMNQFYVKTCHRLTLSKCKWSRSFLKPSQNSRRSQYTGYCTWREKKQICFCNDTFPPFVELVDLVRCSKFRSFTERDDCGLLSPVCVSYVFHVSQSPWLK